MSKPKPKVVKPQSPVPARPYERGRAPALVLCGECKCYMPVQHNCRPIE